MPLPTESPLIVALHAVDDAQRSAVGAKAARLGELVRAGLAVPEGLVLTVAAWQAATGSIDRGDPDGAELVRRLPPAVRDAIESIAEYFGAATVAVRSSAVVEDGSVSSYAGQFTTVLNVRGYDALRDAVGACWAGGFSEQVRGYRGAAQGPQPVAVLVQRQVAAEVSGVAFTADPVTGSREAVVISAAPGLGEALVSGAAEADEWAVTSSHATALRLPHDLLDAAQATAIATMARRIERLAGSPQDVEWALAAGRLLVLQARPVTALPRRPVVDLPAGSWVKEAQRYPEPMTELGCSALQRFVGRGLTRMSRECGGLIDRFELRAIGGEPYIRVVPLGGGGSRVPPWWLLGFLARVVPSFRHQMRRARRAVTPEALAEVQRRWEQEWRPEMEQRIERLRSVDPDSLPDAGLADHLAETIRTIDRSLDLHFRLTAPYAIAVHSLLVACRRLGWTDPHSIELLTGTSQATSAPWTALAQLTGRLSDSSRIPAVLAVLDESYSTAAELTGRLAEIDAGLGAGFADWCARFGLACVNDDPGSPTLAELPEMLARLLRDAMTAEQGGASDRRLARLRQQRAAEARTALAERGDDEREAFEHALAGALRLYPVREDAAFWTGSVPAGLVRRAATALGRRLAERGMLDSPDDVVNLDIDTIQRVARDLAEGSATGVSSNAELRDTVRAGVARVRSERAWVRAHPGPAYYGDPPAAMPNLRGLPAAGRRVNEALAAMQAGARDDSASAAAAARTSSWSETPDAGIRLVHRTWQGVPGSPGRYTGPARVVRGSADFGRVRAGDVVVCPTTDPAWSLLFGVAGALVTDGGNVLSHAAIVAREHGIPAVVGTGSATQQLRDGQQVTVDGTAGAVMVTERSSSPEPETAA